MKQNEIASATVATLKKVAKENKVKLPKKADKPALVQAVTLHFFPKSVSKGNTLSLAKAAKNAPTSKGKLAATFQALKSSHDAKDTIKGLKVEMWKSRPNAADFDGMTVRFTDEEVKGVDKAILSTIKKAIAGAGLKLSAMTIRKGGSAALFVK